MDVEDWRGEFVRGALRYAVLAALSQQEGHGYELSLRLKNHGFGFIKGGVMYPLLRRLEGEGLLAHTWDTASNGPAKKVFRLMPSGRQELTHAEIAWAEVGQSLAGLAMTKEAR